jgi:hypothetical protein
MVAEPVPVARSMKGNTNPRICPPAPMRSMLSEFEANAAELGITLYPWQRTAARYLTALEDRGRGRPRKSDTDAWKYKEVCVVVARQNGKTELFLPRILMGLKRGETILHTAQNRRLPRKTFLRLAKLIAAAPELNYDIRKANGQEEITTPDGGRYFLVAPNASARGESADLVVIDEVREQRDQELMDAMLPTITARPNSQIVYLSNAGAVDSVVLNDLRDRGTTKDEPRLAYIEWSASPDRDIDDVDGWAEANPALGYGQTTMETLTYFRRNRPVASFETENLCRWVNSVREPLVDMGAWARGEAAVGDPDRPEMAVSMDPSGTRASVAVAWQRPDDKVALRLLFDVPGNPIDVDRLGRDVKARARAVGVRVTGFDPMTDKQLVRHFARSKSLTGQEFANATARFVELVESGRLVWEDCAAVGEDLTWTARKQHDESGSFQAVRANDERPVTAALASIRAVWLASQPRPTAAGSRPQAMGF